MNKLPLLALTATLITAPAVFAQAKNFAGFSITLNAENTRTTEEWIGLSKESGISDRLGLQFQYAVAVSDKVVLGAGATFNGGENVVGTFVTPGGTYVDTTSSRASLDFLPGVAVSKNVLVYGKFSYLTLVGEERGPANFYSRGTARGTGYGLGMRALFTDNAYLQVAYDVNKYPTFWENTSGALTTNMDSTVFSVGVGYRF
jgi:opacity protein-like surface antigen